MTTFLQTTLSEYTGDLGHATATSAATAATSAATAAIATAEAETEERSVWLYGICICLILTAVVAFLGNVLVLVAFVTEPRLLKVNFNIFILNLAVTDLAVSFAAIPFYIIDYYGVWPAPLGRITCGIWIFCDWGLTFVSIFTLVAISVDRYWAVCWGRHYHVHNTRNRSVVGVLLVWICFLIVWTPPFLADRVKTDVPVTNRCIYDVHENYKFAIFVAIAGYHGPSLVILLCYIKVVVTMRKSRQQFRQNKHSSALSGIRLTNLETADTTSTESGSGMTGSIELQCTDPTSGGDMANSYERPAGEGKHVPVEIKRSGKRISREYRIFTSVSYVIVCYLICWTPFHVVFDVKIALPQAVHPDWYSFASLMCYLNSALNPFLYACANEKFRTAFFDILSLKCCGRSRNVAERSSRLYFLR